MEPSEVELLSNKEIPENVRAKIAEKLLEAPERKAQRDLERDQIASERRKFLWNTPLVAAVAGLFTLAATFWFDRVTASDNTANTITLEQVRNELQLSEARLKQDFEIQSRENLARLEAEAKEREFQYEIVRSELQKDGRTNAQRAAVLLFLARAGVLAALDEDELRAMAQEQQENPEREIIPQLSTTSSQTVFERKWPINKIPVCWDNPTDEFSAFRQLVRASISDTWEKHSIIEFIGWTSCDDPGANSGIRVRVEDTFPHTKGLGRMIAGRPAGVVLNFAFEEHSSECKGQLSYCIRAYAVHEFGHALGFSHEHNRSDTPGSCLQRNFQEGSVDDAFLSLTPWDAQSVMNYCNPTFFNGGELSELDKRRVSLVYGSVDSVQELVVE